MNVDIAKDVALFVGGLTVGVVGYFFRRKIERTSEQEDLDLKERLLRINREMTDQQVTPEELHHLRATLFSKFSAHSSPSEAELAVNALTHSESDRIVTQAEMNQTSYEDFERAELELRQAYERLRSVLLDEDSLKQLEKTQRAWLQFRKQQVSLAGSFYEGGTIQPLIHNVEAQAVTEARAKQLKELYDEVASR